MSQKDELMARSIVFAYDEQLGYLTACPTNLGTGLRASAMMFLPALTLSGLMPKVIQSAMRLGLTVRGIYGEGSTAVGYMYQVSNEVTLGVSEDEILTQVEQVADKIAQMEQSERQKLKVGANALAVKDECMRSFGILTNCALLPSEECEKLCASVKLGACLGYINIRDISSIDDMVIQVKPSNLNLIAKRVLTAAERDAYRAEYAAKFFKETVLK
jgi:protein arginine kinase